MVTINTLEFVAKLKDANTASTKTPETSPTNSFSNISTSPDLQAAALNASQQSQQQMPTSYIQSIISKILCNICIIVNNVIVKFVEDDIVLSFNMKSAEFFSVNELWEKAYVEVNDQNLHLRKMLQLNDVTICLDKLDSKKNQKINFYQDPLIYRCSIQSRFDFVHTTNKRPNNPATAGTFNPILKLIKLNFYCQKFDVSITDQQLPMLIRLIELIMAIVDGTLKLPEEETDTNMSFKAGSVECSSPVVERPISSTELLMEKLESGEEVRSGGGEEGWLSWAWSYVPAVLGDDDDEDIITETLNENVAGQEQVEVNIGFYFDEFNIAFKVRVNWR